MPEVAAAAKGSTSRKVLKQSLTKVTKSSPKKQGKPRKQSYSTYVYRVLTQDHHSTRILPKAMSVMNFFVVDIFVYIISEASHLIHYNKGHIISTREVQSNVRLMLPWELAKHTTCEGTKVVTKYTNSI